MMKLLRQKVMKGLFALALFLTTMVSWGQLIDEGFESSSAPSGWTMNSITYTTNNKCTGSRSASTNANGDYMITPLLANPSQVRFSYRRSGTAPSNPSLQVGYASSPTATTWTSIGTVSSFSTTCQTFTYNFSGVSNIYIRVIDGRSGGANEIYIDDFIVEAPALSNTSDIIRDTAFTEPTNIDYLLYQGTSVTTANSIEVGRYIIRDGGASNDSDANATVLTNIGFTVANFSALSRLAIYDGSTKLADASVTSGTVSFSALNISAADDTRNKALTLRATFKTAVTDNSQLRFTVSSATANASGSQFAAANAGAAATSITGDANRIEVTADRLAFVAQPANTLVNTAMTNVTVSANDVNGNRDLDFTAAAGTVALASSGTLTGAPVSVNATNGLATFSGLTHTAAGNGLNLTVSHAGNWTTNSNAFNITKANQTITFGTLANVTYGDADFTLSATGGASGEPVTYESLDTTVATVNGNIVTVVGPGETIITASQAGNGSYNAATPIDRLLVVRKKQLTITGATAHNKVYDGTDAATITGATLTGGIVGADEVMLGSTINAFFEDKNIGTGKEIVGVFTLAGAHAAKYQLTADALDFTADITVKELTIAGIAIADKNFDSTTNATITGTAELVGVASGDDVTLDVSGAVAVFDNMGPGAGIPVTVSGYAIAGAGIANYTLIQPAGLSANINDTGLVNQTITFNALNVVTYGDAPISVTATASSGLTVTYSSSDENIATVSGSTVTITGAGTVTITALQEGNGTYNPAPAVSQELVVNKKVLTVANAAVTDKIYNGGDVAELTGTLPGIVGDDEVILDGTGQFTSVNAGGGITVETVYGISGADAGNYELTQPGNLTGTIVPAGLTLADAAAADKVYDGTTEATITGTLTGIVTGDAVSFNGTGTFASPNVNNNIEVTSTATLQGSQAGNYVLVQPTGLTAAITGKNLTVTAVAQNKVYDRTTAAAITVTRVTGAAEGDNVVVVGGGTFQNITVGANKPVTAALTLSGDAAANYTLTQPTGLTAEITAKNLTVTSAGVADKTYDGTATATIENAVLNGIVAGDEAGIQIVSGTFAQGTPGTGIAVSNLILSGSAAANYTLTQPTGLTGTITGLALTLSNATAQNKIYDSTTATTITGTLTGIAAGDVVTFTGTGTFASADVANGIAVTANITLGGEDAANYTITQPAGITANITPKTLTVTGVAAENKVYNRATATTLTGTPQAVGMLNGDIVSVGGTPAANFTNYTVGNNKPVTVSGYTLEGAAANYTLQQPQGLTANITPKTITMAGGAVTTKVYDGNTNVQVANIALTGVEEGDNVNAITGTLAVPDVGTHFVTVALSGANAANYTLTQADPLLSGSVTKKTLTVTAVNKTILKGAAMPAFTVSFSGFVTGDTTADIAEVPTATVAVTNTNTPGAYPITLSEGEADNYELTLVNGWFIIQDTQTQPAVVYGGPNLWVNTIDGTNPENSNPFTDGQVIPANTGATRIAVSGIGRGSGINGNAGGNRYNATGWTNSTSPDANDYYYFTITPQSGFILNLSNFVYTGQASGTGPKDFVLKSSLDNYNAVIGTANATGTTISLSAAAYQNLTSAVTFRLYGYRSSNVASGTFSVNDFSFEGTVSQMQQVAVPGTAASVTSATTHSSVYGQTDTYQIVAGGSPVITGYNAVGSNASGSLNNPLPQGVTADTQTGLVSFDGTTPVGTYYIKVAATNYYGTGSRVVTYTVIAAPVIHVTPNPVTFHTYQGQGASAPVQIASVTGSNLSPASGNISLSVTGDFEIALGIDGFTSAGSFAYTGGAVNLTNPQISVRLKGGLASGQHTGTLTFTGGGATHNVVLTGVVEDAPSITTAAASFGPYCIGTQNNISVAYTTTGNFPAGSYYVQLSNAAGIFPTDFSNTISSAASGSPIAATLPNTMTAGNYRVRVIHLSTAPLLTFSINDNGTDIAVKALPTLTAVQVTAGCAGTEATIQLSGLLPEIGFTANYTVGSATGSAAITADATGNASFGITLTAANNGQDITITSLTRTDVSQACAATFNISATLEAIENMWTGAAGNSDWNDAANWSCGHIPTTEDDIVVGAGTNQPIIANGQTVRGNSLTIENDGVVTVQSGANLIITNAISLDNSIVQEAFHNGMNVPGIRNVVVGSQLNIENNANLIQVNDVANSGYVSVAKESAPVFRLDYALWSSPVSGETLKNFSPFTLDNRFYKYNPVSNAYNPVAGTTQFGKGQSYLIRLDNTHTAYNADTNYAGTPWSGTYVGTPNNGIVSVNTTSGYNAVGNPYPSPINIAAFYAENAGSLGDDSMLYFWRKKNGSDYSSYASLNLEGYTANGQMETTPEGELNYGDASNGLFNDGTQSGSWVLNPGQGFIVETNGNPIVFNNAMRRTTTNGQIFSTPNSTAARLWINLKDAAASFHQAMISYTENGTPGIDYGRDGKALTDGAIALYSIVGESNLGIQARPVFESNDVVTMGYKVAAAGTYTIEIDHTEGVFSEDQDIFLRDNLLGTIHNLKQSAYSFATEAGTFIARFDVIYAQPLGTDNPSINPDSLIVYKQEANIHITSGALQMNDITIYDTRGRVLYSKNGINASEAVVTGLQAQEQVLIVKISTEKGQISKKIIF